jgi:hypothetical protein
MEAYEFSVATSASMRLPCCPAVAVARVLNGWTSCGVFAPSPTTCFLVCKIALPLPQAVYNFWQYELCDVFIELMKPVMALDDAGTAAGTAGTAGTAATSAVLLGWYSCV